jgi:hypothetical protein
MYLPIMTDVATLLNDCLFLGLGLGAVLVKVEASQPLTSVSCTPLRSSNPVIDLRVEFNYYVMSCTELQVKGAQWQILILTTVHLNYGHAEQYKIYWVLERS